MGGRFGFLFFLSALSSASGLQQIPAYRDQWETSETYICPTGWTSRGPYCYQAFDAQVTWDKAYRTCRSVGGNLVYIRGVYDSLFVEDLANNASVTAYWTGLQVEGDSREAAIATWSTGQNSSILEQNWAADQPDLSKGECILATPNPESGGIPLYKLAPCDYLSSFVCSSHADIDINGSPIFCTDGTTVPADSECDWVIDCENAYDEMACYSPCKETLNGTSGTINVTSLYYSDTTCIYTIIAPPGDLIRINFTEFSTEPMMDFIQVYVGGQTEKDADLLMTLSGSVNPGVLDIPSNIMFLKFVTDSTVKESGFLADWESVSMSTLCGSALTATTSVQVLTSPEYPSKYLGGVDCLYTINGVSGTPLSLLVTDIELGEDDYLEIYEGTDPLTSATLVRYEGPIPIDIQTSFFTVSSDVAVRFHTDESNNLLSLRGFSLQYSSGCSVALKGNSYGKLSSPGYATNTIYPNIDCSWTIQSDSNSSFTLIIDPDFELEDGQDTLEVSGASLTGASASPSSFNASGGYLEVKMQTNIAIGKRGFQASYSVDCPLLNLNMTHTVVTRGSFSFFYGANFSLSCVEGYYFSAEEYQGMTELEVSCLYGGSWTIFRTPICSRAYCGVVPEVINGYALSSTGVEYGDSVTYRCDPGFLLEGADTVNCTADGSWGPLPTCVGANCSSLPPIDNMIETMIQGDGSSFGSIIQYECQAGYELVGSPILICRDSLWSDSQPSCKKRNCTVETVENGQISTTFSSIALGESYEVTCDSGYVINGSSTVTCASDLTVQNLPTCEDVDECDGVNDCQQICVNTVGGYECSCNEGFNSVVNECFDINECGVAANGNCDDVCNNRIATYQCSCETPGYTLYTANGTSGIFLPEGATGLLVNDSLYIDHSCVRVQCPAIPTLSNGQVLSAKSNYLYEDKVEFLCDPGYVLNGSSEIQCSSDGTWNGTSSPSCIVGMCTTLDIPPDAEFPPDISGVSLPLQYGDVVRVDCTTGLPQPLVVNLTCTHDVVNDNFIITGGYLDCPVVSCGVPPNLTSAIYAGYSSDLYGAAFYFTCDSLAQVDGDSSAMDRIVRCEADGKWDFGTLRCLREACSDPGRPAGGYQNATSYEAGSLVYFGCNRDGFTALPEYPIVCEEVSTGVLSWNASVPQCYDTEAPVFTNCPTSPVNISLYDRVNSTGFRVPIASDNTDLVTITTSPSYFTPDWIISGDLIVNYTAVDTAGNEATCSVSFSVIDVTPPQIMCPNSTLFKTESLNITIADVILATAVDNSGSVSISYSTEQLVMSTSNILQTETIVATATDANGNSANCTFQVSARAPVCSPTSLSAPANGNLSCSANGNDTTCVATCKDNFFFYGGNEALYYNCSEQDGWFPSTFVPDCNVPFEEGQFIGEVYLTYTADNPTSSLASCVDGYLGDIPGFSVQGQYLGDVCSAGSAKTRIITYSRAEITFTSFSSIGIVIYYEMGPLNQTQAFYLDCLTGAMEDAFSNPTLTDLPMVLTGNGSCQTVEGIFNRTDFSFSCPYGTNLQEVGNTNVYYCFGCGAGTYYSNDTDSCVQCPTGEYQNSTNQLACTQCPSGYNTEETGSKSIDECLETCPAGYTSSTGLPPCQPCPVGSYSVDAFSCTSCSSNTTTLMTGSTQASDCISECLPGTYSPTGYEPCFSCPPGFFTDTPASTSCAECLSGEYTLANSSLDNSAACIGSGNCPVDMNKCVNGTCQIVGHVPTCMCNPGYTGELCDIEIDECASNPCYYGSNCTDLVNGYQCDCTVSGTTLSGTRCETEADDCVGNDCANGGMCQDLIGDFKCFCPTNSGFTGPKCTNTTDLCKTLKPCVNGNCSLLSAELYECTCDQGYTGQDCQYNIDDCEANPCLHGGTCNDLVNGFNCSCAVQYEGTICENPVADLCQNSTCSPGGSCVYDYLPHDIICVCNDGFTDVNDSCQAINFCSPDPCVHGTCQSGALSALCTCDAGWIGSTCAHNEDDCAQGDLCENGGTCVDLVNGFECNCETGFSGLNCSVNDDDCTPSPCVVNNTATCVDGVNSFTCECKEGWTNTTCDVDIDECTVNNPCLHGANCTNTDGGYICQCADGWNGTNCENIASSCSETDPCDNAAQCIDLFNDFYCDCAQGLFGKTCSNGTTVCESANPCINGAACMSTDPVTCSCPDGFSGSGCQFLEDLCSANPCENNATCVPSLDSYTCECPEGYSGTNCSVVPDGCLSSPCGSGATCVNLIDSYYCECDISTQGYNCSKDIFRDFAYHMFLAGATAKLPFPVNYDTLTDFLSVQVIVKYDFDSSSGIFFTGTFFDPSQTGVPDETTLIMMNEAGVILYFDPNSPRVLTLPCTLNDQDWHDVAVVVNLASGDTTVYCDAVNRDYTITIASSISDKLNSSKGYFTVGGTGFRGIVTQVNAWSRELDFVSDVQAAADNCNSLNTSSALMTWREYDYEKGVERLFSAGCNSEATRTSEAIYFWNPYPLVTLQGQNDIRVKDVAQAECLSRCLSSYLNFSQENFRCLSLEFGETSRGQKVCHLSKSVKTLFPDDFGSQARFTYYELSYYRDKTTSPVISSCPDDLIIYSDERRLPVSWTDPTFTGMQSYSQNYLPGELMGWGEYQVSYVARSSSDFTSHCDFKIFVHFWQCESSDLEVTDSACLIDGDMIGCDLTCPANQTSDVDTPSFPTCAPTSAWNPVYPFRFEQPECQDYLRVENNVDLNIVYPITTLTGSVENTLNDRLNNLFKVWNNSTYPGLCSDESCSNVNITLLCFEDTNCTVSISVLYNGPDFNSGTGPLSVTDLLSKELFENNAFDFSEAQGSLGGLNVQGVPVLSSSVIDGAIECPSGYELRSEQCVECAAGSYYDNSTTKCELCSIGFFQNLPGQDSCVQCQANTITELKGSTSQDECRALCSAGEFFNKSTGLCEACDFGFYQPTPGLFYCEPCGVQQTTQNTSSDSASLCFDECPSGQQLNSTGGCVLCPIGTYRSLGLNEHCKPCPAGFITPSEGSVVEADCSIAGTYRDNTTNRCFPCPVGEYQPEKWQTQCLSCNDSFTTVGPGSTSEKQCTFFCPSGFEESSAEVCTGCPQGTYKDNNETVFGMCTACPENTTTPYDNSTSSAACSWTDCGAGTYLNTSTNECVPCDIGTFQPDQWQTSCLPCNTSFTTNSTGATSPSQCLFFCPSGFEERAPGSETCVSCPRGTYKDGTENVFGSCLSCPNGTITTDVNSTQYSDCSIPACLAGTYLNVSGNECLPCEIGTYQPNDWQESCIPCNASFTTVTTGANSQSQCKFFCESGFEVLKGKQDCAVCPRGTYKDNSVDRFGMCQLCPSNVTTPATNSTSLTDCYVARCGPGAYLNESINECMSCDIGTYQPDSLQTSCILCNDSYTTNTTGATSDAECLFFCPSGFEASGLTCVGCQRGYYKDNDEDRFGSCVACTSGFITAAANSTASSDCSIPDCPPGTFLNTSANECVLCEIGSYQPDKWQTSCIMCNDSYTTTSTNSTSEKDCKFFCESGFEVSGKGTCSGCDRGFFKDNSVDVFGSCVPCPINATTATTNSTSVADCSVVSCEAGFYLNATMNMCYECPVGSYQDTKWQESCIDCPATLTTEFSASIDLANCTFICPSGFEAMIITDPGNVTVPNECISCPVGYYKNNSITLYGSCTKCPAGFITANINSTSESDCTIADCGPGSYRNVSTNMCYDCEIGTYQPDKWKTSCIPCKNMYTTNATRSTNVTDCLYECPSGFEAIGFETCSGCPRGFYKDNDISPVSSCTACPSGFTTLSENSTSLSQCNITACAPGSYLDVGNNSCVTCGVGTYQSEEQQTSCLRCPQNTTTQAAGSSNATDCLFYCPPGSYVDPNGSGDSCIPCARDSFKDNIPSPFGACSPCPSGFITPAPGAVNRSECTVAACVPGEFLNVANNTCLPCEEGTFSNTTWQTSCLPCPDNYRTNGTGASSVRQCNIFFCPSGYEAEKKICKECPVGTYKNNSIDDLASCQPCPAGFITATNASTSELNCTVVACEAGQFRNVSENTCELCPIGTFQPDPLQTSCLPCNASFRTSAAGATSAANCSFYCESGFEDSGSQSCSGCARGYYKDNNEDPFGMCKPCPTEFITAAENSTSAADCTVANCSAGTFINTSNQCEPCGLGTYQSSRWARKCSRCPVGQSTSSTGSTSVNDCSASCAPGFEAINETCTKCDYSAFKPNHGVDACTPCPNNLLSDSLASTSQDQCVYENCTAGNEFDLKTESCVPCERGYYRTGASGPLCDSCPVDFITPSVGSASSTLCNVANCSAGSFLNETDNTCVLCPRGSYQSFNWQTSCDPCPTDFTTAVEGAVRIGECYSTNECDLNTDNCSSNAQCINTAEAFYCICNDFYVGDGYTCTHLCDNGYCLNSGTCSKDPVNERPLCRCTSDFDGPRCSVFIEPIEKDNTGTIVGAVIGGVIGAIALGLIVAAIVALTSSSAATGTAAAAAAGKAVIVGTSAGTPVLYNNSVLSTRVPADLLQPNRTFVTGQLNSGRALFFDDTGSKPSILGYETRITPRTEEQYASLPQPGEYSSVIFTADP